VTTHPPLRYKSKIERLRTGTPSGAETFASEPNVSASWPMNNPTAENLDRNI